jgi:hypothetical protein
MAKLMRDDRSEDDGDEDQTTNRSARPASIGLRSQHEDQKQRKRNVEAQFNPE